MWTWVRGTRCWLLPCAAMKAGETVEHSHHRRIVSVAQRLLSGDPDARRPLMQSQHNQLTQITFSR
jgi:hypothetical protein